MKRMNDGGFSLIELAIAIAIIAIMAVGGVSAFGYLDMANTSKCAARIDNSLTTLKSKTMANTEEIYMHLYRYDDKYYVSYSDSPTANPATEDGDEVGNSDLTLTFQSGSATPVEVTDTQTVDVSIRQKDGSFKNIADIAYIHVTNNDLKHTVTLVGKTGKHYAD